METNERGARHRGPRTVIGLSVAVSVALGVPLSLSVPARAACPINRPCDGEAPEPVPPDEPPGPPTVPPGPRPTATFAVELAHLGGNDGTAYYPNWDVARESNRSPVSLLACGTTNAVLYRWTFSNGDPQIDTTNCSDWWWRPLSSDQRSVDVTLTAIAADGQSDVTTRTVTYRDIVIASLGDSAASGEGAPEGAWGEPGSVTSAAGNYRVSEQCDRSGKAASAKAALELQERLPGTTVHFWHLACAGATITSQGSDLWGEGSPVHFGGVLDPYSGVDDGPVLPPQVDRLQGLLEETRSPVDGSLLRIDRLLMTAGANDLNWAGIAKQCLLLGAGVQAGITVPGVLEGTQIACLQPYEQRMRDATSSLPARFDLLATRLDAFIAQGVLTSNDIFLNEYWDPVDSLSPQRLDCFGEPTASMPLRVWAVVNVENPLQDSVRDAAHRFQWGFVGGIRDAFQGHGLCRDPFTLWDTWMNSSVTSFGRQGDVNGSWHANDPGQEAMATILFARISHGLGLPAPVEPHGPADKVCHNKPDLPGC